MNYKRLIENIYQHRFKTQSKNEMLGEITLFELSVYEDCKEVVNVKENLKYKDIFFNLKKELVNDVDSNKVNYLHIRRIINKLREEYKEPDYEIRGEIFIETLKEIIECGLNLSENKEEVMYLSLLDKEIKKLY